MLTKPCRALAGALFACGMLVACDDDSTTPNGPTAELRVLHATSSLGAIDLLIDGSPVIQGITFGNASAITEVPAGTQHLVFRSGGLTLGELDVTLSTEHLNAVTVADSLPRVSGTVIPDTGAVISNRANIRLVNVVGSNAADPTLLHVLINAPGVGPDSVARIGMDTKVASYGTLMYWDPGQFRFRFVPENTEQVLTEITFSVAAGEAKAVVLEREASGAYKVQVVAEN